MGGSPPDLRKILRHPFIRGAGRQDASGRTLRFYIRQDALYLDSYARRLARGRTAARKGRRRAFLPRPGRHCRRTEPFTRSSSRSVCRTRGDGPDMSVDYTSVLEAQATAPVEVEAAAVPVLRSLPAGRRGDPRAGPGLGGAPGCREQTRPGRNSGTPTPDGSTAAGANPEQRRAAPHPASRKSLPGMDPETYADPGFCGLRGLATRICDELAAAAGAETRSRMTELFVRCTRMEWLFWESAWNLENWKI